MLIYGSVYFCTLFAFHEIFIKSNTELIIVASGIVIMFGLLVLSEFEITTNVRTLQSIACVVLNSILIWKHVIGDLSVL